MTSRQALQLLHLPVDHQMDQLLEAHGGRPAQALPRLRGVSDEVVELGRAANEIVVDPHMCLPVEPEIRESRLDQIADAAISAAPRATFLRRSGN